MENSRLKNTDYTIFYQVKNETLCYGIMLYVYHKMKMFSDFFAEKYGTTINQEVTDVIVSWFSRGSHLKDVSVKK